MGKSILAKVTEEEARKMDGPSRVHGNTPPEGHRHLCRLPFRSTAEYDRPRLTSLSAAHPIRPSHIDINTAAHETECT
ncbi:hypothetical protein E2C01_090050 [Portunus trituberculatus]|uniref:Uncharacterized protein n=1 Tax=Portunus trituberculatus TaxID=210409 RepID=A0A5B7JAF8_PORTR|nr:hypothetical protein [Portunus trituberculatus]